MKVIFIQNVAKQGTVGEVKEVADGFALNVLFPKKQAILATPQALRKIEQARVNKEFISKTDQALFVKALKDLKHILEVEKHLEISGAKTDEQGNLFSRLKEVSVAEAIEKKVRVRLATKQIIMPTIKRLGVYEIKLTNGSQTEKIYILVK